MVLGIVSVVVAVAIVRTLLAQQPLPPPPPPRLASAPAPPAPVAVGDAGPGSYGVIAARNLFSPDRTETTAAPPAPAPVAKPLLFGVIVDGVKSRAFLEDPTLKRVAGYSVGDKVGGGTLQKIADDRVVIARPEGLVEVLLQDPTKPRSQPAPAGAQASPAQATPAQALPAQATPAVTSGSTPPPPGRARIPLQRQPRQ